MHHVHKIDNFSRQIKKMSIQLNFKKYAILKINKKMHKIKKRSSPNLFKTTSNFQKRMENKNYDFLKNLKNSKGIRKLNSLNDEN